MISSGDPRLLRAACWCFFVAVLVAIVWCYSGCSRHDVGDERNNPAPSSSLTLAEAQVQGAEWASASPLTRKWSTPSATSSMVPYLDSHSVVLLETFIPPARIHDIVRLNEGPGRENILHQVDDIKDGFIHVSGKNARSDGWYPLSTVSYRTQQIIYSKG